MRAELGEAAQNLVEEFVLILPTADLGMVRIFSASLTPPGHQLTEPFPFPSPNPLMAAAGESDSQDHVSVAEQGYLHLMQGRAESELLEGDR